MAGESSYIHGICSQGSPGPAMSRAAAARPGRSSSRGSRSRRWVQGDAGFLEGFAHGRVEDALARFQVPRWGSAQVPRFSCAGRREPASRRVMQSCV
jgi:hypothetical protein